MATGVRLDVLLEEKGLVPSRTVARTLVMDGSVLVNGQKVTKPGTIVKPDSVLEVLTDPHAKYVSRGGFKLEKALLEFGIDVSNRICLDVGASTGGFTDCLLQHGAQKVFAVDVGYGQLEWKLRQDSRVVVKERFNARYLTADELEHGIEEQSLPTVIVMDVSFISIEKVLPAARQCLNMQSEQVDIVSLIKPQFEAGPKLVGKGGVVRESQVHVDVLNRLFSEFRLPGLFLSSATYSPIKGPKGNIEFLAHWRKQIEGAADFDIDRIEHLVKSAHEKLAAQATIED